MPRVSTRLFGDLDFPSEAVIDFPAGLKAFEDHRQFVFLDPSGDAPLVCLQSLSDAALCFLALPVRTVDPDYELLLSDEDLELLGSGEHLALALLTAVEQRTTANLLAPVVINPATRRAVQSVRRDNRYSHVHPVVPQEAPCL